jgi:hypothetical protein
MALRLSLQEQDWHAHNRELITQRSIANSKINEVRKKVPDSSFLVGPDGKELPVFGYSGQKLNSAELQKQELRRKFAQNEKDVLWTYSESRNTGCFPLLNYEVDLENILRAQDPDRPKDPREPWRYPKTRDPMLYRKPDRDVDEQRRDDLKEPWDEGVLSTKLALRDGVVHNAFDAKSLGVGGAHVIELRRPGILKPEGQKPPGPTRREREDEQDQARVPLQGPMKFPRQNNMGTMNTVDKYHACMLQDPPMSKGFHFSTRHVGKDLTQRYGKAMEHNPEDCTAAPVSIQVDEDFQEEKRNSVHPFKMSELCLKPLVIKPPLTAREKRLREQNKKPLSGTLANWQNTCLSGRTQNFQKPAFAAQAVTPMPLSAR